MKRRILFAGSCGLVIILGVFLLCIRLRVAHGSTSNRQRGQSLGHESFELPALNLPEKTPWTQVNVNPYHVSSALDALCRAPLPEEVSKDRQQNPHANTDIFVYVNPVGIGAMFSVMPKVFPEGSVIVKQKFDSLSGKTILYTIMTKRYKGYNPQAGDWGFSVISADGSKIEASGKLANCMGCHIPQAKNDYVFRPYFTTQANPT